jgi:hypothetical protein
MLKSTVVKWAVAALLTVPAVPLFARTPTHHRLTSHARAHRLAAAGHRVHRYHHLGHHAGKMTASKRAAARRLAAARHHAIRTASIKQSGRLKITRMPPTIDNIGA